MPRFIRHCVECPKCLTRYLVAFSPYGNGSYLTAITSGASEEYILYCSCRTPLVSSRWNGSELKKCVVSKAAHDRGYGTAQEVVPVETESRNQNHNDTTEMRRHGGHAEGAFEKSNGKSKNHGVKTENAKHWAAN